MMAATDAGNMKAMRYGAENQASHIDIPQPQNNNNNLSPPKKRNPLQQNTQFRLQTSLQSPQPKQLKSALQNSSWVASATKYTGTALGSGSGGGGEQAHVIGRSARAQLMAT